MKIPVFTPTIALALMLIFHGSLLSAPADHLAPLPVATAAEQEVINLLQFGKVSISTQGRIAVPLYNPTRYVLRSCVVRVHIPELKIDRIYNSENCVIESLHDGFFVVPTMIDGAEGKQIRCELLKLSYDTPKK